MLKRRITLSCARVIMRVNWQLVIAVVHTSDINASFCRPRQKRGDIILIHIYSATTKGHVPQAKKSSIKAQLTEQMENY